MSIRVRSCMVALLCSMVLGASCEKEGSESQQAAQVADVALQRLDAAAENVAGGDGNRAILLSLVDKAIANDPEGLKAFSQGTIDASRRFYMQADALMNEAKEGLERALQMNIFPVQRQYYELQLEACAAYADQISAAQSELKVFSAEKRTLDPSVGSLLQTLVAAPEKRIKNARDRLKDIWAKMDKLKAENPGSFRPATP